LSEVRANRKASGLLAEEAGVTTEFRGSWDDFSTLKYSLEHS